MKKSTILCFFAVCVLAIVSCFPNVVLAKDDVNLVKQLDAYFSFREKSLTDSNVAYLSEFSTLFGGIVSSNEEQRMLKLRDLEKRWDVRIIAANTSYDIIHSSRVHPNMHAEVYEWTFFDFVDNYGVVNTSGYGVSHQMVFELLGENLLLIADYYDEGQLTNARTKEAPTIKADEVIEEDLIIPLAQIQSSSYAYNPQRAVKYSNRYVYTQAWNNLNSQYYNREYKNYNVQGGDCANYVSQSLAFAGIPQASSWYYSFNGTPCTNLAHKANDDTSYSSHACTSDDSNGTAWYSSTNMRAYMGNNHGTIIDNPVHSNILTGNPVYYWWGDGNPPPPYNHTTICVGTQLINGIITPIVNSHNMDYYNVKWNYGSSKTKYSTVQLTPTADDFGNSLQTAGNAFGNYDVIPGVLSYTGDEDFIKFVPYASASYGIYTTGATNTYGELLNSSGGLITADTDSGEGTNFRIVINLNAWQTYYIKVRHQTSGTGAYTLYIHDPNISPSSVTGGN